MHSGQIIGIHQPNFLPWIGYFLKIAMCSHFVFLDDVQFSRKRAARCELKTKSGEKLTISLPVHLTRGFETTYADTIPSKDNSNKKKLLNKIKEHYQHSPFFKDVYEIVESRLLADWPSLRDLNTTLINDILRLLKLEIPYVFSSELNIITDNKNQRNLEIVKKLHGIVYYSGTGATAYNNPAMFTANGIELRYAEIKTDKLSVISPEDIHLSVLHHLFIHGPDKISEEITGFKKSIS